MQNAPKIGWMIEREIDGHVEWLSRDWVASPPNKWNWTVISWEGLVFDKEEDGKSLLKLFGGIDTYKVTEHMWM